MTSVAFKPEPDRRIHRSHSSCSPINNSPSPMSGKRVLISRRMSLQSEQMSTQPSMLMPSMLARDFINHRNTPNPLRSSPLNNDSGREQIRHVDFHDKLFAKQKSLTPRSSIIGPMQLVLKPHFSTAQRRSMHEQTNPKCNSDRRNTEKPNTSCHPETQPRRKTNRLTAEILVGDLVHTDKKCHICLDTYELASDAARKTLGCGHTFHAPCVETWVSGYWQKASCPNDHGCPVCIVLRYGASLQRKQTDRQTCNTTESFGKLEAVLGDTGAIPSMAFLQLGKTLMDRELITAYRSPKGESARDVTHKAHLQKSLNLTNNVNPAYFSSKAKRISMTSGKRSRHKVDRNGLAMLLLLATSQDEDEHDFMGGGG